MVGAVRQLGELTGDGNDIARVSKVAVNLNALEGLLFIKYEGDRVIRFEITLDDQTNCACSAIRSHRNIALLIRLLEGLRVGLRVLLSEGADLLTIRLEFVFFLFDDMLLESAAAGLRCRLRVQLGLL